MRLADDPLTLEVVMDWVTQSTVSLVVGLVVGAVSFPLRWAIQGFARRRGRNVTAYREAHRVLRAVQLANLYPPPPSGVPGDDDASEKVRAAATRRAWDEALHSLAYASDKETHRRVGVLADLHQRGRVMPHVWREAEDDPRPLLLSAAVELLAHKARHAIRRPEFDEARLESVARFIAESEVEAEAQWQAQRADYEEWLSQRHAK